MFALQSSKIQKFQAACTKVKHLKKGQSQGLILPQVPLDAGELRDFRWPPTSVEAAHKAAEYLRVLEYSIIFYGIYRPI